MLSQTKAKFPFLGIKLLKNFTNREINRFTQFIESPYFNTDAKLITLFKTLVEHILQEDIFTDKLQCLVFEMVFDEKTNRQKLVLKQKKTFAAKLSKLTHLAQKFLVIEGLNRHEIQYQELLYYELLDKKQFEMFYSILTKNKKQLENKQRKEIIDFEHLFKIENIYLEYLFLTGELFKAKKNNLFKLIFYLDMTYILNRLHFFCTIFSIDSSQIENYDNIPFSTMNNLLKFSQYKKEPNIIVHKANYKFLKNFDEFEYKNLLETLKKYESNLPVTELQGIYAGLLNFFTLQKKKGVANAEIELFILYELMDQKNLLLADSFIPSVKLKNLVGDSLKIGATKKAKYFLKKYIPYVTNKDKKSIYNFCLSGIAFYEKDYDKALEHIIQVESINLTYDVNCRFLRMKIYYEIDQDYNERTVRLFRSAAEFFKTNKALSAMDKKSYKNFVQILVNLYRIKHHEGKMTIQKLQEKLDQQEFNADKKWLLEKMGELKAL